MMHSGKASKQSGNVIIGSGNTSNAHGIAGNITILGGRSSSPGLQGGNINISAGNNDVGKGGSINLRTGLGSESIGNLSIETGSNQIICLRSLPGHIQIKQEMVSTLQETGFYSGNGNKETGKYKLILGKV